MTTFERIAVCNALADAIGELARNLNMLAAELAELRDEMATSLDVRERRVIPIAFGIDRGMI